ncbi:MAG TPA: glyoxalase [Clostridiales bacterium]|nr:glyoxalase [Clostridiales bacterium]
MKYQSVLIAVSDLEKSKEFYGRVCGSEVILDFGANVTLTGGFSLQTVETWQDFIGKKACFGGNNAELYFEEDDFDAFVAKLAAFDDVHYVHPVMEYGWGQRAVRLYDPDDHIIEIGEAMTTVVARFIDSGLSVEDIAGRMDVPVAYVRNCLGEGKEHGI